MKGVTPGPWTVTPAGTSGNENSAMIHSPEGYIAEFMYCDFQANAQFACDARELFDRVEEAVNILDGNRLPDDESEAAVQKVRELVQKMKRGGA